MLKHSTDPERISHYASPHVPSLRYIHLHIFRYHSYYYLEDQRKENFCRCTDRLGTIVSGVWILHIHYHAVSVYENETSNGIS